MPITKEQALRAFGLGNKEQKIYLAVLELGSSTANQIANKANLNRSTTYDVLKALIEKGVCSTVIKKRRTFFEALPPKQLAAMLEEKKQQMLEVLPELEAMAKTTIEKPLVELYEGKEGISAILDALLEERKEILVYGPSKIFDFLSFILPHYIRKRIRLGLRTRVIQEKSPATFTLMQKDAKELRQTRYLDNYKSTAAVFISGKKTAIIRITEREPLAVFMVDESIAESQKAFFEKTWNVAKHRKK